MENNLQKSVFLFGGNYRKLYICIIQKRKNKNIMRVTIANTQKLASQKGIAFSVSRYGKKSGYEYWTNQSITETGEATQFKGNLKEFYLFIQEQPYND